MIRLWGGGIYEPEVFYDLCDGQRSFFPRPVDLTHDVLYSEFGLLVWQDFQFACGVYPAHDEFVESVRQEAVQVVRRLRKHPSTALFCGNNEGLRPAVHAPASAILTHSIDYQQVLQWGDVADLPARRLYEDVLPGVVARYAPEVGYHRGSPYGGAGWDTADPTVGDVHQWDVWAGKGLPFQDYDRLGGRFVRSALVLLSNATLTCGVQRVRRAGDARPADRRVLDGRQEGRCQRAAAAGPADGAALQGRRAPEAVCRADE
jgi:beta-mannosidase